MLTLQLCVCVSAVLPNVTSSICVLNIFVDKFGMGNYESKIENFNYIVSESACGESWKIMW